MTVDSSLSSTGDADRREPASSRFAWWPVSGVSALVALLAFVVCLVVGYVWHDGWGTAAQSVGVPLFALAFGAFAADAYYRKEGDKKVQEKVRLAAYTTLNIQYALVQAHGPVRAAKDGAYEQGLVKQVGDSAPLRWHCIWRTVHHFRRSTN